MMVASFLFFLLMFVVIGLWSMRYSERNSLDYLLAGHNVKPWLAALSAVATNNSGYMFIGMIGYTYLVGWSSIWMMLGWISGDFAASMFIHRKVREQTVAREVHTYAGLLSHWHDTDYRWLRALTGLLTLIFLGTYAAAQLSAGGKALHVLFGWSPLTGALIGSGIVLAYCFAGGIRASIWTDAAQSFVMLVAMALMLWTAISTLGGVGPFLHGLAGVGPHYLDWLPPGLSQGPWLGGLLFVMGWFFAGFGVVGQPHIMVRFMALDNPDSMTRVRLYYYGWFILFFGMTIVVGLAARLLLPQVSHFDAELALPTLAQQLLPGVLTGLVLAGIFAATMSTADSLVLSCSASLTRDFRRQKVDHYLITKGGTVFVTLFALGIALFGDKSVFHLVLDAWGVLASGFAPLLTVYALGRRPSEALAIAMVLVGIAVMYLWGHYYSEVIYAAAPGIGAGFVTYLIGGTLGGQREAVAEAVGP